MKFIVLLSLSLIYSCSTNNKHYKKPKIISKNNNLIFQGTSTDSSTELFFFSQKNKNIKFEVYSANSTKKTPFKTKSWQGKRHDLYQLKLEKLRSGISYKIVINEGQKNSVYFFKTLQKGLKRLNYALINNIHNVTWKTLKRSKVNFADYYISCPQSVEVSDWYNSLVKLRPTKNQRLISMQIICKNNQNVFFQRIKKQRSLLEHNFIFANKINNDVSKNYLLGNTQINWLKKNTDSPINPTFLFSDIDLIGSLREKMLSEYIKLKYMFNVKRSTFLFLTNNHNEFKVDKIKQSEFGYKSFNVQLSKSENYFIKSKSLNAKGAIITLYKLHDLKKPYILDLSI